MTGDCLWRVLVAEDDPKSRRLVRDLLTMRGCQVTEAANGRECVEMARRDRPDLVLMDMQMPIMDGYTAARMLRHDPTTAHIPVIAVTAYAMAGDEAKTRDAGCVGYITKPIEIRTFVDAVTGILAAAQDTSGSSDPQGQGTGT
jgi:two-component system cell cycle response regulator DivK